jgi:hypothetical protein
MIKYKLIDETDFKPNNIEGLGNKYCLQMVVWKKEDGRYYAKFQDVLVGHQGLCCFGIGRTPEAAIDDYVDNIRGQVLSIIRTDDDIRFVASATLTA